MPDSVAKNRVHVRLSGQRRLAITSEARELIRQKIQEKALHFGHALGASVSSS